MVNRNKYIMVDAEELQHAKDLQKLYIKTHLGDKYLLLEERGVPEEDIIARLGKQMAPMGLIVDFAVKRAIEGINNNGSIYHKIF
ncbi:hypothetical protein LCGC14_0926530 [marine sediment metagenome]|uniref:Uncharacterized protein n=1 Tax=marine sediment metagenome TaxID=412755 RepID=A0A0F9R7W1_9ZZZZ